jgi:hypothetical protein
MASPHPHHRWLLLALLLAAAPAAAKDAPRITGVRPLEDRPYLVVDVAFPKAWPETRFTFEADGKAAPARALGGGFDSESNLASYLVFPGASCKQLVARWGKGARDRTAATRVAWKAPALAVLLDRLGDREALLLPRALELQVFPPATARFLQDGAELTATPVEASGPGRRLRVAPRWRAGLNTVRVVVKGPGGKSTRDLTFVLLDGGALPVGESAQLVYAEVGTRSGPFHRVAVEGTALAVEGDRFDKVLVADDDGWILEDEVQVAKLSGKAPGQAVLRIEVKEGFLSGGWLVDGEHRIAVGPGPRARNNGLDYDPVEDDPRYAEVFARIDAEVDAALADHPQRGAMGFCHVVWGTKKRLLKNKYGIDWRSPDEMNPQVIFD